MTAKKSTAKADPKPAKEMTDASGAIVEEEIKEGVDTDHPAVDNNPRKGTSADQNRIDFNDPKRRKPNDEDYEGMGLDPTPYGKKPSKK